jgi:eukaryotic-like serine/threonine-protein kinase
MTHSRWPRVKELLGKVLEVPEAEREAYLVRACPDDEEVRNEVTSLLQVPPERLELFDRVQFELRAPEGRPRHLPVGARLASFRIVAELERGGMGAVYRAEDEEHGRPVAVKVLHRRSEGVPHREARILARLNHGNIARLYDSGTTPEGDPYFVMEHVDGVPLDRFCDERRLSIEERLRLFRKVCAAVEFAHRNQIVHRDLKPDNVLVTEDGEPKLLDFGISKLLDPEGDRPLAGTTVSQGALTPAFASPEQVAQERTNTTTDIYSLGVILHLLLTGRLPYAVQNHHELYWTIKEVDPERPSRIVEEDGDRLAADGTVRFHEAENLASLRRLTPWALARRLAGDMDAIALQALRKEPERRYRTVQELSDEIERYLKSEPVRARKASPLYRGRKFLLRNRWASGVVALLLLGNFATLGSLALARFESESARREAERAAEVARREQRRAEQVTSFLLDTFDASSPLRTAGEVESVAELLGRFRSRLATADLESEVRARLASTIASAYRGQGLLEEGARFLEEILVLSREEAGEGSMPVALVMDTLGVLEHKRGNHERAEHLIRAALAIFEENLDPASVDIADAWDELALTLFKAGRLEEALKASERAIALLESPRADDGARSLLPSSLSNLGLILFDSGELERSEAVQRRALRLLGELEGDRHPNYAIGANNLAKTLLERNRYSEASDLLKLAVSIHETNLSEDHPDLLGAKNNLAAAQYYAGEVEEAAAVQEEIVRAMEAKLGPDHPTTLATKQNLGRFLAVAGDTGRARPVLERAYERTHAVLGGSHWLTANGALRLAVLMADAGELVRANALLEGAATTFTESHGAEHFRTLEAAIEHARVIAYRGDLAAAEGLARETCRTLKTTLGKDHWRTAVGDSVLGEILALSGDRAEAEMLLGASVRRLESAQGPNGPHTREAAERLARARRAGPDSRLAASP